MNTSAAQSCSRPQGRSCASFTGNDMTQDEIIEMARQANILEKMGYENPDMKNWRGDVLRELSVFAKLIAAKEREACAKLADENAAYWAGYKIAVAIRARGEA